ncbi:hypothetical protein GGI15_002407 [Coemansia interrupta]|uniref:Major facilitator superfamily (MFS) profile domain-containing protein n=1 Tax=Coemansia interrupta TaxID=1126814 RepID=A0A9W8LLL9_9FUNG|nr:hypothetical protein GGI15_002407 [Coemansia interrupta]
MAVRLDKIETPVAGGSDDGSSGTERKAEIKVCTDVEKGEVKAVDESSLAASSQLFNKEEIPKGRMYAIVIGLMLLYFVSALETTVLATVYIDISNMYDDMSNGIWIITSYLLSTTVVQPLYGKFSDILGRFEAVVVANVIFCVGSILCAVSSSMGMLIASRAIQGIGGGGLMTMVSVILSDVTNERDRGKYTGFLAASWGIASAVGPVMGGAIVENSSWRIIFWINLPICVPALIVLYFALRIPRPAGTLRDKLRRIDFLGALVFQAFVIPMIIAFAWGGQGFSWRSARVLATICGAAVVGIVFLVVEWKVAAEPIVPLRLFRKRNVTASALGHFCVGSCIYAPLMFVPSWELSVRRASETSAGLHLLPLMGSMVAAAGLAGVLMARLGRYRQLIWACGAFIALGNSLLILYTPTTSNAQRIGTLVLTGLGLGFGVQTMLVAAQCAVRGLDMAATTTVLLFMRTLGGIFALSILSSVFNTRLRREAAELSARYPDYQALILGAINDQSLVSKTPGVPAAVQRGLQAMFQDALHEVFVGLAPFSGLLVLSTLLFAHVELQQRKKRTIK